MERKARRLLDCSKVMVAKLQIYTFYSTSPEYPQNSSSIPTVARRSRQSAGPGPAAA